MTVFITYKIPDAGLKLLEKYELDVHKGEKFLEREEMLKRVEKADAVITLLRDVVDREFIDSGRKLKIIANYAVGYNNIDVEYATEKGIYVTHTPGVLTETTADLTWALILAVSRRIVEADEFTRSGKFEGWKPELLLGLDVFGKTLGIIGFGRIGKAVARRAKAFDMRVLYYSRKRLEADLEKWLGVEYRNLDDLLKESDIVSLHVPLTEETHHLIDEEKLLKMKKGAILVNTSRGPVVDEKALVEVLKTGHLFGAGLDVFENEPEVEPELLKMKNVVLLPHIGSATKETREKMAIMVARNVIDALEGRVPENLVPEQRRTLQTKLK